MWGLLGSPNVLEDMFEDVLGRLVATQIPDNAPTENFHLVLGLTTLILFG